MSDPRVFFAAERTLLAWVRTGITLMALGFVVARFGLFLTLVAASDAAGGHGRGASAALGIALVILGAGSILAALHNHRVYVRSLPREDVPEVPLPRLTSLLALSVAVAGLLLVTYLAIT